MLIALFLGLNCIIIVTVACLLSQHCCVFFIHDKNVFTWSQTALMSSKSNMFEEEIWKEEMSEYDALITRSKIHSRVCHEEKQEISSTSKSRKSPRRKYAIHCMQHDKQAHVPLNCSDCVAISMELSLPNGRLPTNGQVLAYSFTINQKHPGVNNFENICLDVMLHWISCNVYTITKKAVRKKLDELVKSFRDLQKIPKAKRGKDFYSRLKNFQIKCNALFDIRCNDNNRRESQQRVWGDNETFDDV